MQESRSKARRVRFSGALLLTQEPAGAVSGDLWVEGRRIAAVSPLDPEPSWEAGSWQDRDCAGLWILPGFVQVHTHLCQSLFRGAAEGLTLYGWLSRVIWPLEAAHDPWSMEVSARLAVRQLLSNGTTAILDMGTTRHTDSLFRVAEEAGIRAFLGPALMDRGPREAEPLLRSETEALGDLLSLASRWDGRDDGRLRVALCPRFVPSVTDPFWKRLASDPDLRAFPLHTHGSETLEEVDDVRGLTGGLTPPAYLAGLDGASGRVKMAHAVHLTSGDRKAMAGSAMAALHCPGSNFKLGSGLADVRKMRQEGIRVGLGADGAPCNNRLDPWSEMRSAASVQSLLHGPESVSAADVLRMATLGGAEVLDLDRETGSLRQGKRADFVLLDPELDPAGAGAASVFENPEALLVFAGSPAMVEETWVDGRAVFARSRIDRDADRALARDVEAARGQLAERSGLERR